MPVTSMKLIGLHGVRVTAITVNLCFLYTVDINRDGGFIETFGGRSVTDHLGELTVFTIPVFTVFT